MISMFWTLRRLPAEPDVLERFAQEAEGGADISGI
jgi:hypothetical protein